MTTIRKKLIETSLPLDAIKELGFVPFHEAEKKKDAEDVGFFTGLGGARGDLRDQARMLAALGPRSGTQQSFDFDEMGA